MNKMKIMSVVWGMVIIGIFVLLTLFGFLYKNKTNEYKKLEEILVEASKKYVEKKFSYPEDNQSIKISLEDLKKDSLITEFKVKDDECDGYVTITKKMVFEYIGYVKCSNYTTKDYQK